MELSRASSLLSGGVELGFGAQKPCAQITFRLDETRL